MEEVITGRVRGEEGKRRRAFVTLLTGLRCQNGTLWQNSLSLCLTHVTLSPDVNIYLRLSALCAVSLLPLRDRTDLRAISNIKDVSFFHLFLALLRMSAESHRAADESDNTVQLKEGQVETLTRAREGD